MKRRYIRFFPIFFVTATIMGGCDPTVSPFFAHVPYIDPSENPEQATYLKASNTGFGDWFGRSVALSGGTLAVGAPYESSNATGINGNQGNNGAPESGAVYVRGILSLR